MEVPLVEASVGDVNVQPGRCATNVLINPSNQVIIGKAVFSKSDIMVNKQRGVVIAVEPGLALGRIEDVPFPSKRMRLGKQQVE